MSRQSQPQHKIEHWNMKKIVAIAIKLEKSFYWQLLCGILFVELNTGIRVETQVFFRGLFQTILLQNYQFSKISWIVYGLVQNKVHDKIIGIPVSSEESSKKPIYWIVLIINESREKRSVKTLVKSLILSSVESYVSSISASSYFGYCLGMDSKHSHTL